MVDEPRTVLISAADRVIWLRKLLHATDRVDAVDMSPAMIECGRAMEGGDHRNLCWILGRAEDAPVNPPYALVTAGDSLQWMDWPVILRRIR